MTTTYPNQRKAICDHLYHDSGGHFVLTEANRDLFGAPVIAGGYREIRPLTYEEALTVKLDYWQGLLSVYQNQERKNDVPTKR